MVFHNDPSSYWTPGSENRSTLKVRFRCGNEYRMLLKYSALISFAFYTTLRAIYVFMTTQRLKVAGYLQKHVTCFPVCSSAPCCEATACAPADVACIVHIIIIYHVCFLFLFFSLYVKESPCA